MKSLMSFLAVVIAFVCILRFGEFDFYLLEGLTSVTFVTNSLEEQEYPSVITSGEQYYVTVSADEAKSVAEQLEIVGLVLNFKNISVENITSQINFVYYFEQELEGLLIYYGYTSYYDDYVWCGGYKTNVQIAQTDNKILVGFPMILTGF